MSYLAVVYDDKIVIYSDTSRVATVRAGRSRTHDGYAADLRKSGWEICGLWGSQNTAFGLCPVVAVKKA